MKRIITFICVLLSFGVDAQKQNNTWCFGDNAGIDFNGGSTTSFSSMVTSQEGGATVSDRNTGALLFYADGQKVWNSQHNLMSNGSGIGNDPLNSCMQGTVIVPFPDDNSKYYIFSLEPESQPDGVLYYSVVDMTLNGGLGNVVTGQKKIKLGQGFVEGMFAAPTCDGHWLLLSSKVANEFHAYRISASGIDTNAVVSQMPYPYIAQVLAPIKVSPDGKKLLYLEFTSKPVSGGTRSIITLHDFDEKTGKISNGQLLDAPSATSSYYSAEFSQDGSKAYISDIGLGKKEVLQYDLSLPTLAAITASRKTIYQNQPGRVASLLQMAPDGNIYVALDGNNFIDRISNTNAPAPGCVYTINAVTLAAGTKSRLSFPPAVTYAEAKSLDTVFTVADTTICVGSSIELRGIPGALSYNWQDNSTQQVKEVKQAGTYWVTSSFVCLEQTDTYNVATTTLPINLGDDTAICFGRKLIVDVNFVNDSTSYLWQDSSTADSFVISEAGMYYVIVNSGICVTADTIQVAINDSAYFDLGADTILCAGTALSLNIPADVASYTWSTGATDSVISVAEAGEYALEVSRGGCTFADTIEVDYAKDKYNIGNDTTLCNGQQLVLDARSELNSSYSWSSGLADDTLVVSEPGIYTVTIQNRCGTFIDTAVIDFKVCDCNPLVPNAFTPNNDGHNDKFGPILRCISATYKFIVINRFGEVVFKTTELNDRWDGTYKGQPCDFGTYYYMIQVNNTSGTDEFFKGDVILIR